VLGQPQWQTRLIQEALSSAVSALGVPKEKLHSALLGAPVNGLGPSAQAPRWVRPRCPS